MYSKRITYKDYDGNELTETFLFNLTKAEIVEMQLSTSGGFSERIQRIIDSQDVPEIIKTFKELILASYGEKSPDGKRFMKRAIDGHRLADDFTQTEAYSELFMELATNADSATEFINKIVPQDAETAAAIKNQQIAIQDKVTPINQ